MHQKRHLKLLTLELNDHFFSVLPLLGLVSLGGFQWYIQGFHHGVLQENNPLTSVISLARWLYEDVGMCNSNSNPSLKLPRIHVSFPEEKFFSLKELMYFFFLTIKSSNVSHLPFNLASTEHATKCKFQIQQLYRPLLPMHLCFTSHLDYGPLHKF